MKRNYLNRSSFALFVALLIHFMLLLLFWVLGTITKDISKPTKPQEERMKVSLKELPDKFKDSGLTNQQTKPQEKLPPMPKGSQFERIVEPSKIKPFKFDPNNTRQETKTDVSSTAESDITVPKKMSAEKYDSYAWLSEDKSAEEIKKDKREAKSGSNINNDVRELYGSDFDNLTEGQQKYILDNQEIMRRITQEVLNRVASVNLTKNLNINRVNIIEFYLHPNGDISDVKFIKTSGYYILDKTTQETIEYAYSKYPRPTEKTLIRYNVYYNLAAY